IHEALQAELDRFRVYQLAVVEFHPGPELELPRRGGHELGHLSRESRLHLELGVALEEGIEDVPADIPRGRLLVIHRVEGGRVDTLGDDHLALRGGGGGHGERGDERGGEGDASPGHGDLHLRVFRSRATLRWTAYPGPRDGGPGRLPDLT